MSVTKTIITDLVSTLCYGNLMGSYDAAEVSRLYDEVILALAQDPRRWFTTAAITDTGVVDGGATPLDYTNREYYQLPATLNLAKVVALFFQGRQLSRENEQTLRQQNLDWESDIGTPLAFVTDQRSDRFVRFYPKNDKATQADDDTAVVVVYTRSLMTTGIPDMLALPIALLVLAREFERESPHRDKDFAEACRALGTNYLSYIA